MQGSYPANVGVAEAKEKTMDTLTLLIIIVVVLLLLGGGGYWYRGRGGRY